MMAALAGRPAEEAIIRDWVQSTLGGTVSAISSQPRWRPHWFVDATVDGSDKRLLVRGDRVDTTLYFPLRHEMEFQDLLYRGGIPVPEIHGWIEELPAFVSDNVPGRPDFAGMSAAERDVVVDEYLHALAAIHALDVGPFIEAGIAHPEGPGDPALFGMERMETVYRTLKVYPNPFMEFCLGWFHRHPPNSHG